jgi:hypothetical protein
MRAGETERQTAVRHVAEQENRIVRQKALIERLRKLGTPLDEALRLLVLMQDLLEAMRAHVARIPPCGETPR